MSIGDKLKGLFSLEAWTDRALVQKSMPSTYYIGQNGIHNYSQQPGFSIIEPEKYRGEVYSSLIYGGYSASNFLELFHCIPEIFAPIDTIASAVANADFQLRKTFNDEIQYKNKEWNRLFNTPNPLQHFRELMYEAVVYHYTAGNEYMYFNTPYTLTPGYENIAAIWNLPADQITPVIPDRLKLFSSTTIEDLIIKYKLDDNNSYNPKDVLHIKAVNLDWKDRKIIGKSPMLSADKAVKNLIAVYEARNVIYTKRGALGFIVSRKSDASGLISLTSQEKKNLREEYNADYGITSGRSPVAITEAPVDFVKVGMSISELQPFEETLADAAAIYGALKVPFELAPKKEQTTFSNQQAAERRLYQNVVIPLANNLMQSITNKLGLDASKLYLHASFENVEALQENKKEKADVNKTNTETARVRFTNGIITLNDWVVESGYERSTNAMYDKRIYDMTPEELEKVIQIINLKNPMQDAGANEGNGAGTKGTIQAV